jgi:hypothetical protein
MGEQKGRQIDYYVRIYRAFIPSIPVAHNIGPDAAIAGFAHEAFPFGCAEGMLAFLWPEFNDRV